MRDTNAGLLPESHSRGEIRVRLYLRIARSPGGINLGPEQGEPGGRVFFRDLGTEHRLPKVWQLLTSFAFGDSQGQLQPLARAAVTRVPERFGALPIDSIRVLISVPRRAQ